jgi:hypothetical protein
MMMNTLGKFLVAGGIALMSSVGAAQAGTYSIAIYNGTNPSPGTNDLFEKALPGASSIFTSTYLIAGGPYIYSGNIAFLDPTGGTNNIAAFLTSGGGTFTPTVGGITNTLSSATFGITTGLAITFTTTYTETLKILHDDGVALYSGGTNLLPDGSALPTATGNDSIQIGAGTYTMYYIEANGLPAQLNVAIAEPLSLSLLGAGLAGLGLVRRRKAAV